MTHPAGRPAARPGRRLRGPARGARAAGRRRRARSSIVHRDVSPQNILVSTKGVAKLIDFGIAKARDRASGDDTNSGVLKGKIQYMAPEQALGPPGRPARRRLGRRRHPLPPALGQAAVRGRQPARRRCTCSARADPPCRSPTVHPAIARRRAQGARARAGEPLRDGGRAARGDRGRDGRGQGADDRGRRRGVRGRAPGRARGEAAAGDRARAGGGGGARRVEELLRPPSDRGSLTAPSRPSSGVAARTSRRPRPRSSAADALIDRPRRRGAEGLAGRRDREAHAARVRASRRRLALVRDARLGGARCLRASCRTRSRKGVVAIVGARRGGGRGATIVSFTMFRPKGRPRRCRRRRRSLPRQPPYHPTPPRAARPRRLPRRRAPPRPPRSFAGSGIPVISASSLPRSRRSRRLLDGRRRRRRRGTAACPRRARARRQAQEEATVDDGF